jgi:hypothetical protein
MDECDQLIEIPTFGLKNSLNVASACPIGVCRREGRECVCPRHVTGTRSIWSRRLEDHSDGGGWRRWELLHVSHTNDYFECSTLGCLSYVRGEKWREASEVEWRVLAGVRGQLERERD